MIMLLYGLLLCCQFALTFALVSNAHNNMDCDKRKSAFENVHIQIILRMRSVSSGPLLSIRTFRSIQWFC